MPCFGPLAFRNKDCWVQPSNLAARYYFAIYKLLEPISDIYKKWTAIYICVCTFLSQCIPIIFCKFPGQRGNTANKMFIKDTKLIKFRISSNNILHWAPKKNRLFLQKPFGCRLSHLAINASEIHFPAGQQSPQLLIINPHQEFLTTCQVLKRLDQRSEISKKNDICRK